MGRAPLPDTRGASRAGARRWRAIWLWPLLAACALALAEPAPYQWRNVAIGGGGFVTGIVFHPHQPGLAYARTDVGGAYRWEGAARRWVPLNDGLGRDDVNLLGIESLAVDPADPDRLYLAAGTYLNARTGNGAILRSHDRGRSFARSDLPFKLGGNEMGRGNGERLAVDPNDGRVLLFGSRGAGLWRSGDAGATWSPVAGFPAVATASEAGVQTEWAGHLPVGIVSVVFDAGSGRRGRPTPTIYAGVSTGGTSLYVSHDAGTHWAPVAGQPRGLRPTRIARAGDGVLYLSYGDAPGPNRMNDGAVWRYAPATGEWHDITPAPQSSDTERDGFGWGAVAVDPADPKGLLASTFCRYGPHDEIFRSVDGGAHWTPLLTGAQFDHDSAEWTRDATPHWIAALAIDPFDADHAMFVTGYGVWASRNLRQAGTAPVRWSFDDAGLEETVPLALVSPATGAAALVSGVGDLDGFRHDDLDRPQRQLDGPRLTNTEALADAGQAPERLVRAGRLRRHEGQVRLLYSRDGGAHWRAFAQEPPDGQGAGRVALAADGGRVLWTPEQAAQAWFSDDLGTRWQPVQGLPASAIVAADRFDPRRFYAYEPGVGTLRLSDDGGATFRPAVAGAGPADAQGAGPDRPRHADVQASTTQRGTVYVGAGARGLLRFSGRGLERLPGVEQAYSLGLGKPAPGAAAPTLFVYGRIGGIDGLFRSGDDGVHWRRIDDDAHRYGRISRVTGDPRRYGRVYFATEGRGIVYGDPR